MISQIQPLGDEGLDRLGRICATEPLLETGKPTLSDSFNLLLIRFRAGVVVRRVGLCPACAGLAFACKDYHVLHRLQEEPAQTHAG
jgi:hypothetical protein